MLFNLYSFIFIFFPVVLLGYFRLGRAKISYASAWLVLTSLFFYGYWNPAYLPLLLGSIVCNFSFGRWIAKAVITNRPQLQKYLMGFGIAINLVILGYYKYANFFINNLNTAVGTDWNLGNIILPLGVSFFTFTQISFLVDTYQGKIKEYNFTHYALFVTYFPHLIAGPVLHHKEMMPQFDRTISYVVNWDNIATGLTIFIFGLAKKILIADHLNEFVTPIFNAVSKGGHPMLFEAWVAALAYTLQLYFDFSAYSNMAIGVSKMFNVQLPMNFDSPYKSKSIIEFWRCWHMTLSRFLRDYLYIPMGGNRNGSLNRYKNLMLTMLLGGLWHGAGWTFLFWGGLHGVYLIINHLWINFRQHLKWTGKFHGAGFITFIAVVVGWVFFRATDFATALNMLNGMAGLNGVSLNAGSSLVYTMSQHGIQLAGLMPLTKLNPGNAINIIVLAMLIVFILPNLEEIMSAYQPSLTKKKKLTGIMSLLSWSPSLPHAATALLLGYLVIGSLHKQSPFLYFQF